MKINAIIASTILAATVSGAALPVPAAAAVEKRDADAAADPNAEAKWWIPYGAPIPKRDAEAEADPNAEAKWRPYGSPFAKREADAEAEAEAEWTPPYGSPFAIAKE
jgi:mating pheromone alpha-factor